MAINIIDTVKNFFSSDFNASAAAKFNENEPDIQKLINTAIPTVLASLLSKSETSEGANTIHKLAQSVGNSTSDKITLVDVESSSTSNNTINSISKFLGDRWVPIQNLIANYCGVKQTTVASLLGIVASAIFRGIGEQVKQNNMSASQMAGWFHDQKENIVNAAPAGFNLAGALGLSSLGSLGLGAANMASGVKKASDTTATVSETTGKSGGNKWLLPLLVLVALTVLLWYFMKDKNTDDTTIAAEDTLAIAPVETPVTPSDTQTNVSYLVKLPNNTELNAKQDGIEDKLVNYLNSSEPTSKDKWFDFDNLNFKIGSAEILPESMVQVHNIAAILKAFPKATFKIGGYTDKTGKESDNIKLSQARADATMKAIKDAGAVPSQLTEAEGYGSKFATVDAAATDEERKKDRRIAINVQAK